MHYPLGRRAASCVFGDGVVLQAIDGGRIRGRSFVGEQSKVIIAKLLTEIGDWGVLASELDSGWLRGQKTTSCCHPLLIAAYPPHGQRSPLLVEEKRFFWLSERGSRRLSVGGKRVPLGKGCVCTPRRFCTPCHVSPRTPAVPRVSSVTGRAASAPKRIIRSRQAELIPAVRARFTVSDIRSAQYGRLPTGAVARSAVVRRVLPPGLPCFSLLEGTATRSG